MKSNPRMSFLLTTTLLAAGTFAACGSETDADAASSTTDPGADGQPAAGITCPTRGALVPPTMPATIAPPADAKLFYRVYAEGTQIYTCQASAAGAPAWTFKAPEAKLYDDRCVRVGSHFAGPTWQIEKDGSTVVGKKSAEAPGQAGAIPWLLLAKNTVTGAGALSQVTFINRVDTVGGAAPASGCDATTLGKELAVPYTATYLYYKTAAAAATTY